MMMPLTLASGARLRVYDEGSGPLMVLISGLGGTAQFWRNQRHHFSSRFRVISFDQPGCGEAEPFEGPVSIECLAKMAAEMTARIAPDQPPTVLAGHSTGGAIAQQWLAGRHGPAPERLVLSGTWACACPYMHSLFEFRIRSLGPGFSGNLGAYADLTKLLACDPQDVDIPFAPSPSEIDPVRAATQILRMRALLAFDGCELAKRINVPTLVVGATDDRIVPIYHQKSLAKLVPSATLEILPDGGHFFPEARNPAFNEILTSWLDTASR